MKGLTMVLWIKLNQNNRSVLMHRIFHCEKRTGSKLPPRVGLKAGWQMKYGWISKFLKFSTSYSCDLLKSFEITFVYEDILVLNIHVNKFSWVPHKNIQYKNFVITVCVSPIKWLLALYASLLFHRNSYVNAGRSMHCVTHWNWGKHARTKTISNW